MATYTGNAFPAVALLNNDAVSVDLNPNARPDNTSTDRALMGTAIVTTDANTFNEPIAVSPALAAPQDAVMASGHGTFFFERIHIRPKSARYPFILSTQLVTLEVWNAYRETSQTVTAIVETGPAGVTITTAHATPIVFAPLEAKYYVITISAAGAARAENSIRFDFSGIPEPTFTITGLRLVPFTISPDWDAGIEDDVAYATAITTAYDDTEQRAALRSVPNRSITYRAAALDQREAGLLLALLHAWQSRSYGVLLWQDAAQLGANLTAGGTAVVADTTNMGLEDGDTAIVIADAFTWFASPVSSVTPSGFDFDTPADQNFTAGKALVVPVRMGRAAESIPVPRPTNASAVADIKFDLQVVEVSA